MAAFRGAVTASGEMVRFTLVPDQRGIGSGPDVAGNGLMPGLSINLSVLP